MNANSAMEATMQLHHVTFPVPPDSIDQAHAFYGDVIGLEQIPVRREVQHLAAWYRLGTCELHLLVNSDWKPPRENPDYAEAGPHFAFVIPSIETMRARLDEHGIDSWESEIDIPGRRRLYCRDPFSNIVEMVEFLPSNELRQ